MKLEWKLAHLKIDSMRINIYRINAKKWNPQAFYKELHESISGIRVHINKKAA